MAGRQCWRGSGLRGSLRSRNAGVRSSGARESQRFTSRPGTYQLIRHSLRRVCLVDAFLFSLCGPVRLSPGNHPPKTSTVRKGLQAALILYTGEDSRERSMGPSDHTRAHRGDAQRPGTFSCCLDVSTTKRGAQCWAISLGDSNTPLTFSIILPHTDVGHLIRRPALSNANKHTILLNTPIISSLIVNSSGEMPSKTSPVLTTPPGPATCRRRCVSNRRQERSSSR